MIDPKFTTTKVVSDDMYGKFELSPLPYGFGHSLGNALRRVLLSSIEGAAVTYASVNNAPHAFETVKGVKESVLEILMNLKTLRFTMSGKGPVTLELHAKGVGKVYAKELRGAAQVVNGDTLIAELTDATSKLDITIVVESGLGYSPSEEKEQKELGMLAMDSIFTPVSKVNFKIEGARVGRLSNFDKLMLEIWTDGSVSPEIALQKSSKILSDFYGHILSTKEADVATGDDQVVGSIKIDEKVYETIIDELDLPTRVINALLREGIETVGDLVQQGKETLVDLKGVGRKSLDLIEVELKKLGVGFE